MVGHDACVGRDFVGEMFGNFRHHWHCSYHAQEASTLSLSSHFCMPPYYLIQPRGFCPGQRERGHVLRSYIREVLNVQRRM